MAATLTQALTQLRAGEYLAVMIDQALLETEPDESETLLEHIGTAIPVPVNFAINAMGRILRSARRPAPPKPGTPPCPARSATGVAK